jgi:type IV fimbrial biogenesis protein FimT
VQRNRSTTRTEQRGLTLVETCAALTIAGILLGIAAPSFLEVRQRRMLEGAAAELAGDLQFARSEAVARGAGVRFTSQAVGGGSCVLIHTGSNGDCQCDNGGATQCSNGASLIKSAFYPPTSGVTVGISVAAIRFEPHLGIATPAGSVTIATPTGRALRHVVNILGRVRTCSPNATSTAATPC